jgi:hypothetical protein
MLSEAARNVFIIRNFTDERYNHFSQHTDKIILNLPSDWRRDLISQPFNCVSSIARLSWNRDGFLPPVHINDYYIPLL